MEAPQRIDWQLLPFSPGWLAKRLTPPSADAGIDAPPPQVETPKRARQRVGRVADVAAATTTFLQVQRP